MGHVVRANRSRYKSIGRSRGLLSLSSNEAKLIFLPDLVSSGHLIVLSPRAAVLRVRVPRPRLSQLGHLVGIPERQSHRAISWVWVELRQPHMRCTAAPALPSFDASSAVEHLVLGPGRGICFHRYEPVLRVVPIPHGCSWAPAPPNQTAPSSDSSTARRNPVLFVLWQPGAPRKTGKPVKAGNTVDSTRSRVPLPATLNRLIS